MNALTRDLKHMTDMVEQTADPGSSFRGFTMRFFNIRLLMSTAE